MLRAARTLTAIVFAAAGLAHHARAAEQRTFVAKWVYYANYSQDADCPQGINPPSDEIFRRILQERHTPPEEIEKKLADFPYSMYLANIGSRGQIDGKPANVYLYPTSVPDPMLKLGEGHVAYGFNLDGKDTPNNFVDPDTGEHGVDNQLFRVVDCVTSLRSAPGHHPPLPEIQWDLSREHNPAWLVQITGIDDFQNDDDVTVRIVPAKEAVRRDASGMPMADMTFTPDTNPRSAGNVFHARIVNGVLVTKEKFNFFMPGDPFIQADYTFTDAHLRISFDRNGTARGILGGYQQWRTLYISWALAGSVYEVNNSLDIPGLYYALRKSADAYPDPKTGENMAISSAYLLDLIPAFIQDSRGQQIGDAR